MLSPDLTAISGEALGAHRRLTIARLIGVIEAIGDVPLSDRAAARFHRHVRAMEELDPGALEAAARLPAVHAWVTTGERLLRSGAFERYPNAHPARHLDELGLLVLSLSSFARLGATGTVRLRGEHRLALGIGDVVVPPDQRLADLGWERTVDGLELRLDGARVGLVGPGREDDCWMDGWSFEPPTRIGEVLVRLDTGDPPSPTVIGTLEAATRDLPSDGTIVEIVVACRPEPWVAGRITLDARAAAAEAISPQLIVEGIENDARHRTAELDEWTRPPVGHPSSDVLDLSAALHGAGAPPGLSSQWPVRLRKTRPGTMRPLDWSSLDVMVELPADVIVRLAEPAHDWPDEAAAWAAAAASYVAGSFARCLEAVAVCRRFDPEVEEHRFLEAFALRHLGRASDADELLFSPGRARLRGNRSSTEPYPREPRRADAIGGLALPTSPFLSGLVDLRRSSLQLPHYLAVRAGLRPALDDWIPAGRLDAFEDLLAEHGLVVEIDCVFTPLEDAVIGGADIPTTAAGGQRYEPSGPHAPDDRVHVVVARERSAASRALAACWYSLAVGGRHVRKPIVDHGRFGAALGYPECCVRSFLRNSDWQRSSLIAETSADGNRHPCANTLTKRTPWMVSNHLPCSFGCAETIGLVGATLDLLDREDPTFGRSIRLVMSQPVLAISEVRMYSLWGDRVTGSDGVSYYEVLPLGGDVVDASDIEILRWGTEVSIEEGTVVVRRDTEIEVVPTTCDRGAMEVPVLFKWPPIARGQRRRPLAIRSSTAWADRISSSRSGSTTDCSP